MPWELCGGASATTLLALRELDAYLRGLRASQKLVSMIVTGDGLTCKCQTHSGLAIAAREYSRAPGIEVDDAKEITEQIEV